MLKSRLIKKVMQVYHTDETILLTATLKITEHITTRITTTYVLGVPVKKKIEELAKGRKVTHYVKNEEENYQSNN